MIEKQRSISRWVDVAFMLLLVAVVIAAFWEPLTSDKALLTGDSKMASVRSNADTLLSSIFRGWHARTRLGWPLTTASWSPRRLLALLLSPAWYVKMAYFVDSVMLAFAMYVWVRIKGMAPFSALCGAVALVLAGHSFTLVNAGHMGKFGMFPYVVFGFLCMDLALSGKAFVLFALGGLCWAMALGQQPDITIMTALLLAGFCLFRLSGIWRQRGWIGLQRPSLGLVLSLFAFFAVAAPSIIGQYASHVKGAHHMQNDMSTFHGANRARSPEAKWGWATQWSLPPEDTLEFVAPCIFGVHSKHPDLPYHGRYGSTPVAPGIPSRGKREEGQYMSALVFLIGFLAIFGVSRRRAALPSKWRRYRSDVLFWCAAGVVTYLLALGKYAPLYQWVYTLPKFSAIRNPIKFLYAFEICTALIFAYGVEFFTDAIAIENANGRKNDQQPEPVPTPKPEPLTPAQARRRRKRRRE